MEDDLLDDKIDYFEDEHIYQMSLEHYLKSTIGDNNENWSELKYN